MCGMQNLSLWESLSEQEINLEIRNQSVEIRDQVRNNGHLKSCA